jgi:hypothetical protein
VGAVVVLPVAIVVAECFALVCRGAFGFLTGALVTGVFVECVLVTAVAVDERTV